jgi:hypothetical protein
MDYNRSLGFPPSQNASSTFNPILPAILLTRNAEAIYKIWPVYALYSL